MTREDLKAKIKDQAALGRTLRSRIQGSAGPDRHALWNEKRAVGAEARVLLLAYGFLRGVPYAHIERHCRPDGRPRVAALLAAWAAQLGVQAVWKKPASAAPDVETLWSEARVSAWLEATPAAASEEATVR
jgi:hypothetical protein